MRYRVALPQFQSHIAAEWWLKTQRSRACHSGHTYSECYDVAGLRELAWRLVRWQRRQARRAA